MDRLRNFLIKKEFDLEKTLNSTKDSETLIRRLVDDGVHSEEIHDMIKRNVDHILVILRKEEVLSSNSPYLESFSEVVDLGNQFINQ
jgi:hypothetical protein